MSKTRVIIVCGGLAWLALVTVGLLAFLQDKSVLGEAAALTGIIAIAVLAPLSLLAFIWVALSTPIPRRGRFVQILAAPWGVAGLGVALATAIEATGNRSASRAYQRPWSQPEVEFWARAPGLTRSSEKQFYRDSVLLEDLRISIKRERRYLPDRVDSVLEIHAVVRNQSRSTVSLKGYEVAYVGAEGTSIGEETCYAGTTRTCGLSARLLRPGYVADFQTTVPLGPSVARRDTAAVFVRFVVSRW